MERRREYFGHLSSNDGVLAGMIHVAFEHAPLFGVLAGGDRHSVAASPHPCLHAPDDS